MGGGEVEKLSKATYQLAIACSKMKMVSEEISWKGGRQSEKGRAGRQSPTSNNLSLYQSQPAWPSPLPALQVLLNHIKHSRSQADCVCVWLSYLIVIVMCFPQPAMLHLPKPSRQVWMSEMCFSLPWNIIFVSECFQKWSAGYKNCLQGRNVLLERVTKQQNVSIKCQNMRTIQRKQDQWGCKPLGGLSLDKHCRWSCIQNPHPLFPNAGKCQHQY